MGWVTSWAGYSLAIPSVSVSTLCLPYLQTEQILGGMFFGFLGFTRKLLSGVLHGGPYIMRVGCSTQSLTDRSGILIF